MTSIGHPGQSSPIPLVHSALQNRRTRRHRPGPPRHATKQIKKTCLSGWHKPGRVSVLIPGPYASGMTHPSVQGGIHSAGNGGGAALPKYPRNAVKRVQAMEGGRLCRRQISTPGMPLSACRQWRGSDFAGGKKVPPECRLARAGDGGRVTLPQAKECSRNAVKRVCPGMGTVALGRLPDLSDKAKPRADCVVILQGHPCIQRFWNSQLALRT
jgi:hypothetical protein